MNIILRPLTRFLKKNGYRIFRIPKRRVQITVPEKELRSIERILREFSAGTSLTELRDLQALQKYLSPERISLFWELVDLCLDQGVSLDDMDITDIGSGMAYLFRRIHQKSRPKRMYGYDTFEEIHELASMICPEGVYLNSSLYEVKDQYDVVFCMEVLEHLVDPEGGMKHLIKCVRESESGYLVLSVPNGRYDFQEAGKIREDKQPYWGHIHFWSPESWHLFIAKFDTRFESFETGLLGQKHLYAIAKIRSSGDN